MNKRLILGILMAAIALVALGSTFYMYNQTEDKGDDYVIVTSFYPMYIATLNVVGDVDGVRVENLSEPETGCLHDYQLTSADMKLLSEADVFVINGGGMEEFLEEVAEEYPKLKVIDTAETIPLIDDENSHVWMSVNDHITQVWAISEQLKKLDKDHSVEYSANASEYVAKLDELIVREQEIARKIAEGDTDVITFHEAFAYLTRDLGLNISLTLDLDEERQVSAKEVKSVYDTIENDEVKLILAEETYGKEMAEQAIEETGVEVIYLNPLVQGEFDKDSYIELMGENLDKIEKYYEQSAISEK